MSVFNEAEYQAAEVASTSQNAAQVAEQSIASAHSGFDKPGTCVKTRRKAQTPNLKELPVLDAAIGIWAVRDRYQAELCNRDAGYARWLTQLVFRYQGGETGPRLRTFRNGSYWWEHSRADWATECGCSEKQVRGYIERAKAANIVDAHRWKSFEGKYEGKTVLHIRLLCADGCPSLNGYPEPSQMRMVLGGPLVTCLSMAPEGHHKDLKKEPSKEEGNIKDGVAENTTPDSTPEVLKANSGKVQNQKKPQASEPVLDLCLSQKLEFLKLNQNADNHPGNLTHELTAADRDIAQRLEFRLTQAGIDPLAFLTWLTPTRFQRLTLQLDIDPGYALLWMGKADHQIYLLGVYRDYLDEQGKFSSSQQIKLCAMAPAGKKPPLLPLYEQNPDIAVGLFSWDQHWLDHQEDGKWGGRTRLEHLRKYSRFTPEMETWITSEAIRERVLDLLGVHDAAAA